MPAPTPTRLPLEDWLELATLWAQGRSDHDGSAICKQYLRGMMPLAVSTPDLACRAADIDARGLLDIVYNGITPSSHVQRLFYSNTTVDSDIFDALIRFHDRFSITPSRDTHVVLLRNALRLDCPHRLTRIPDLDGPALLKALHGDPDLLSNVIVDAGAELASHLEAAFRTSPGLAGRAFLASLRHPCAKSLNILLATGPNTLCDALDGNTRLPGCPTAPRRLLDTLSMFCKENTLSAHQRLSRTALLEEGSLRKLMAMDPDDTLPAVSQRDFAAA